MPIDTLVPRDANGEAIGNYLDMFEYVGSNTTAEPKYYRRLKGDGAFVIIQHSGEGTAMEKMLFYLGGGGSPALNLLWGDGMSLGELTFVEFDELYPAAE